MKMIKGSFARKVNKLNDKAGSIWQSRFYDEIVHSEPQLLKQLEYMHQNPVVANIVQSAEEYAFSSFNQYFGLVNPDSQILEVDLIQE
jgi:hypothetical protein